MSHEAPSIAIVEDDPIMGESLEQCLELAGYRVEWWRTGEEALAGMEALLRISSFAISACRIFRAQTFFVRSPPNRMRRPFCS